MTSRPSTAAPILAALLILALPLVAYIVAYFTLGGYHEIMGTATSPTYRYARRVYPSAWERSLFVPAAWLESRVRHLEVQTMTEADFTNSW